MNDRWGNISGGDLTSENINDNFWKITNFLKDKNFTFTRTEGGEQMVFHKQKLSFFGDKDTQGFYVSDLWSRDGSGPRSSDDVDFLIRTDGGLIFGVSYDFWLPNGKYLFRDNVVEIYFFSGDSEKIISWKFAIKYYKERNNRDEKIGQKINR